MRQYLVSASTAQLIFEMNADGLTPGDIARYLNLIGEPLSERRGWCTGDVEFTLDDPDWQGVFCPGGGVA